MQISQKNAFQGLIQGPEVSFWWFWELLLLKGDPTILIRAPKMPFLVLPKWPKRPNFGRFGGNRNGTLGTRIRIVRPLFNTTLTQKPPKSDLKK